MEREGSPQGELFVYGTLLFPSVLQRVLGRQPTAQRGTVTGYAARTMADAPYPGMVPSGSGIVDGALLEALTPTELEVLDAYEGAPYERVELEVTLVSGERVAAFAYVVGDHHVGQSSWDRQVFADQHLEEFLGSLDA